MEQKTNKLLIGLNLVLMVGLIVLYVLHFSQSTAPDPRPMVAPSDGSGLRVAYVNSDTLLAHYDYAIELEKGLVAYRDAQETNYRNQMEQFQKDYQDYLKNGDKLSLSQQQAKEEELKKRAEKLSSLESDLAMRIQRKQLDENTRLLNAIFGFIKEYNESHEQYDIILRSTFNDSPTLYVNEAMDITQEIIDGLNKEYAKLKK